MPEGPEVETVRRSLAPQLQGQVFGRAWVSEMALRTKVTSSELAFLQGVQVRKIGRKGKLLFVDVGQEGIMVRLGMTGQLMVQPKAEAAQKHLHVRIPITPVKNDDEVQMELRYVDPRRFGEVVPYRNQAALDAVLQLIGPDPIDWSDFEKCQVMEQILQTQRSVKDALLDQRVLSGVGNIYASEALFMAGLNPFTNGCDVGQERAELLLGAVAAVLVAAVRNRGTSFSNYVDARGEKGSNQFALSVFGKEGEPCLQCQAPLRRDVQGGRSTFWCRNCQL